MNHLVFRILPPILLVLVMLAGTGVGYASPEQVADGIYMAPGISNSYLVVTADGNVVIDTGAGEIARRQYDALREIDNGPTKYIILTHAHLDHAGGITLWREPGTTVIAQKAYADELEYQERLSGFFSGRNARQFGVPAGNLSATGSDGIVERSADILFDESYEFRLGELTFSLEHTPGETADHLSVRIPELSVAFIGDNYYDSFPNLYTLRGTKTRWALDYIESLDRIIDWKPKLVLSGHVAPLEGSAVIDETLAKYRDAIRYVHDATVAGMNESKGVFELMREISLPEALDIGEEYGAVHWSVRGIYEGYVGWFDEQPETMYGLSHKSIYPDLIRLAGGPDMVAALAEKRLREGQLLQGLHLTTAVLEANPMHAPALKIRIELLEALENQANNFNERAWLKNARKDSQQMRFRIQIEK